MYIDSQISEEYNVNLLCEALQISKATYYNRKLRGKNGKTETQKRLLIRQKSATANIKIFSIKKWLKALWHKGLQNRKTPQTEHE